MPLTVFAKTENECRGQGNRLHYARCVNKDLKKRPVARWMLHKNSETPCIDKEGLDHAECMRVQARIRRQEKRTQNATCELLDGIAKRLCFLKGIVPTGSGSINGGR